MIALDDVQPAVRSRHVIARSVAAEALWLQVRLLRHDLRCPSDEDVHDAQRLLRCWLRAQGRREVIPYERVRAALARGLMDLRLGLDEMQAWRRAEQILVQVVLRSGWDPSGITPPEKELEKLMVDPPREIPCEWCGAAMDPTSGRYNRRFCSPGCAGSANWVRSAGAPGGRVTTV